MKKIEKERLNLTDNEKWDKTALADYISTLIKELPGDCVTAEISWTKHTVTLECEAIR